ncbi:hypothetical protein GUJ93_ZPchr0006g44769 [Zizania palustris]|uniref:GPN-loop GTPase 2 n=1 Tax=Zizania palustris TaxID=103762 RepID=A0A8J5S8M3_ZIZPA|nr:hypothetical protein GUJ93_ZPchr0006g44769 [Zizania palustris]
MVFGQVVIGPPGSGKTTYCNGMSQFLSLVGRRQVNRATSGLLLQSSPLLSIPGWPILARDSGAACLFQMLGWPCVLFGVLKHIAYCPGGWKKVAVVNLDPANDALPYECAINIEDLIKLSDVMVEHSLGPNGGLVYCMDYLEKNIDWLEEKLKPLIEDHYLLNLRLTAVHLIDAHLCCDPGKYVSALLLSLSTMLHLELPHINVLSKIDLIENYGNLAFNLNFYTDVEDLSYLQHHLDQDPRSAKYRKLTKELCNVIDDFSLVNFTTLDIQNKESVGNLVKLIDKSNGYIFSSIDSSVVEFSKIAAAPLDWDYYRYPYCLLATTYSNKLLNSHTFYVILSVLEVQYSNHSLWHVQA